MKKIICLSSIFVMIFSLVTLASGQERPWSELSEDEKFEAKKNRQYEKILYQNTKGGKVKFYTYSPELTYESKDKQLITINKMKLIGPNTFDGRYNNATIQKIMPLNLLDKEMFKRFWGALS